MKKLIGLKKIKTAVFISGTGSNLKNLIKFSKTKISPILIKLIISSSKKAKGLKYSIQYNIEKKIVNFNNNFSENKILSYINKKNIKFISAVNPSGITLLILPPRPPPVILAQPLIRLYLIRFKISFT